MDIFKKVYDFKPVKQAKAFDVYPYFHALESKQDIEVMMEGARKIMIGSNNYLGLTGDERIIEATVDATRKYGSGVSGSRFLNGTLTLHLELERELADFAGKEGGMVFSTGFQSNLGIIQAIAQRKDLIFSDRENHASIYDANRLSFGETIRYKHNDMDDLERLLKKADPDKGKLIVTDGVFSMSGDICKLPEIVALAKQYGARVMVDDAHGFGVLGPGGRGTAAHFGLTDEVDLIMGTFSKSLASLGGFLVADEEVVDYVRHNARPFIFSAAITPGNAAAAKKALDIIKAEPQRVQDVLDISAYMRKQLLDKGLKIIDSGNTPIIPIYTYTHFRTLVACKLLYERGVYVNPVIPPAAPEGQCLIRTSYTSTHTKALMDEASDIIADVLNNLPDEETILTSLQDEN
ncbi:MAG: aminotransferase class I/II-fold pyridoxal phosphate-dependent enzyme [Bacillota bacterium]